jgi:hypothetical protein
LPCPMPTCEGSIQRRIHFKELELEPEKTLIYLAKPFDPPPTNSYELQKN